MLFPGESPSMSGSLAAVVDEEVARLVNEAHERARTILEERHELLDKLSALLRKTEVIEGEELKDYVDGRRPIPTPGELADAAPTQELSGPQITASPPA